MTLTDTAFQLFIRNGIRAVSIQDIERACGEKADSTINKGMLIKLCVKRMEEEVLPFVELLNDEKIANTERILAIYKSLVDYLLNINLAFFNDLKRYHQESYEHLLNFVDLIIFDEVKSILRRGQEEGQFSKQIDLELECTIHKMMLKRMVWEFRFQTQTLDMDQVFTQLFKMRFEGIVVS